MSHPASRSPHATEMLKGHLDGLILAVLASGPLHGYAVIEQLRIRTGGAIALPSGTIYPALHRLERTGLVEGRWSTETGRRRRVYSLSGAGRDALSGRRRTWLEFASAIDRVLAPEGR